MGVKVQDKSLDKVTFGWIDGDNVSGAFTMGLMDAIFSTDVPFSSALRHRSVFVSKNRKDLLDNWIKYADTDWLFWVDSDIVLNKEAVEKIWDAADKDLRPVVSGLYFFPIQENNNLVIKPCIYNFSNHPHMGVFLDDFEKDSLVKVEGTGFGCLLMHRSVVEKLVKNSEVIDLFSFNAFSHEHTVTEDFNFFSYLLKYDIPVYAHTGAIVNHVKPMLVNERLLDMVKSYNDKQ
ncbi:Glycosyltransferase 2-like [uncultured Caudovirales phage]|uniref:Glycosyltransferase 2-like n=1 Tax=uncultured Caudovirales phage TaxID=2100421 RepID=A0A6J5NDW4_9CAUD|nr:Glycosyltransferase 2-like [uncultured Caudovirales phage]